jgi:hypothetical protein
VRRTTALYYCITSILRYIYSTTTLLVYYTCTCTLLIVHVTSCVILCVCGCVCVLCVSPRGLQEGTWDHPALEKYRALYRTNKASHPLPPPPPLLPTAYEGTAVGGDSSDHLRGYDTQGQEYGGVDLEAYSSELEAENRGLKNILYKCQTAVQINSKNIIKHLKQVYSCSVDCDILRIVCHQRWRCRIECVCFDLFCYFVALLVAWTQRGWRGRC